DATRIESACRSGHETPPTAGGKLAVCHDGSGHGRHVRQPNESARPTFVRSGSSAVVRFDGISQHLRHVKPTAALESFSIFIVAVPRQNPGGFRGFLAFNAAGRRDYESGLTIDLGPMPTGHFDVLNVEGRGFGGARNLMQPAGPFGRLHTLEVNGPSTTVKLSADGQLTGERPREPAAISLDEITIGARYYTNGPGPQQVRGFVRADIAEILVYNRSLSEVDAKAVRDFLAPNCAELKRDPPRDGDGRGELLVPVADPPSVQMLVPGFTVWELPVDLPNINNIANRPDGTLVALGYNGN